MIAALAKGSPQIFIPLAFDRFGGITTRGYEFLRDVRPHSDESMETDPITRAMAKLPVNQRRRFMWERISMGVLKGTVEGIHGMRHGVPRGSVGGGNPATSDENVQPGGVETSS